MNERERNEAIERVRQMETCFDALLAAAETAPDAIPEDLLKKLLDYYEGGQWLRDYELDEQGGLPQDLKRGVLSEDGVYNFLSELQAAGILPPTELAETETAKEYTTMKVYGAEICIDCRNYKAIQASRGFAAEYVDITENTLNLREFLAIRDSDPVFAPVKANHGIGIPLFVREDGVKTFDINEAFAWIGEPSVKEEEIVEKGFSCGENGCK